jgi:hypothetical protein
MVEHQLIAPQEGRSSNRYVFFLFFIGKILLKIKKSEMPQKGIFSRNFFFIEYFCPILSELVFSIVDLLLPSVKSKFKSKKKIEFFNMQKCLKKAFFP